MDITINFDFSNQKALALLNYIKTLDFITIKEANVFDSKLMKVLDERKNKHINNESKSFTWSEVKHEAKNSEK